MVCRSVYVVGFADREGGNSLATEEEEALALSREKLNDLPLYEDLFLET